MEPSTLKVLVGQEIRKQRELQGLSLKQLAVMSGTSYSHLWKVETAKAGIGIDLLCRISNALGIRLCDLFTAVYATDDEIRELLGPKALMSNELVDLKGTHLLPDKTVEGR